MPVSLYSSYSFCSQNIYIALPLRGPRSAVKAARTNEKCGSPDAPFEKFLLEKIGLAVLL
jgi:hypothetical protein